DDDNQPKPPHRRYAKHRSRQSVAADGRWSCTQVTLRNKKPAHRLRGRPGLLEVPDKRGPSSALTEKEQARALREAEMSKKSQQNWSRESDGAPKVTPAGGGAP